MTKPEVPTPPEEILRLAIKEEYGEVAANPTKGFHFHTGQKVLDVHEYDSALYQHLPEANKLSVAGTGNPFMAGEILLGETVVDIGSGSGFDALIAASLVGAEGQVIGIDMTDEMLERARAGAKEMDYEHLKFKQGYMENLPVSDNFADVVISNGVLNLTLNKEKTLKEWYRVMKPGGRLQFGDITLSRAVPESAMGNINLWTG